MIVTNEGFFGTVQTVPTAWFLRLPLVSVCSTFSFLGFTLTILPIVFSGLGAYFFLKEKMNLITLLGMSLVVAGVVIMKVYAPQ